MKELKFNEKVLLKPQRSLYIPLNEGIYKLKIEVYQGKIRINHGAYTPDGGTWLDPPLGRKAHYDFKTGDTSYITIEIKTSFNKTDRLNVIVPSLLHSAEFCIDICT